MGLRYHDASYANTRNGAGTFDGVLNWGNVNTAGFSNTFDGTNYAIDRFFFHFDITSIPTNATIVSAFLRVVGTNTTNTNVDSDSVTIVQSTVTSNTTIVQGDWTNIGSTSYGSLAFASYNNAGNNDITLNATGVAAIQSALGGHVKMGGRTAKDISNTTPSGANQQTFSGTGLLSVTYTVPATNNQNRAFFMN